LTSNLYIYLLFANVMLTLQVVLLSISTAPEFQGQGIGRRLTEWGLMKAKADNIPVYLDSTLPASAMYRKLGFVALDGMSILLPGQRNKPRIYEELGMLRIWDEDVGIDHWDFSMNIPSLKQGYESGMEPQHVVQVIYDQIEAYKEIQPSVWIHLQPISDVMRAANQLLVQWPDRTKRPALWGIPFSVKDSIDREGILTTVGCPDFAFMPSSSAPVYERCIEAGALFIGKTNMEQLATGMTGCRSSYGTLHSTFNKSHIVGGSSSGSAVTVSAGLVSFSIGSDTAGSIRVPALYNGIVGFKPTKGTVSARGVAPASLHQDCVSFLALTAEDAELVWQVCRGFDQGDHFAKIPHTNSAEGNRLSTSAFRFGSPPESELGVCCAVYRQLFSQVKAALQRAGGKAVDLDWGPFSDANELLYNSSFVVERLTIFPEGWLEKNKHLLHPVTRQVFEVISARKSTAVDVFRDLHKQAAYKRAVESILDAYGSLDELTVMVVPTTPFHPTIEEVAQDPVGINGRLGVFAHSANVLDLVGIAMPCGSYEVPGGSLPFGVTLLACGGRDGELLGLARRVEEALLASCERE
jgi:allophanate hydrolase